jgi:hypothetical protein
MKTTVIAVIAVLLVLTSCVPQPEPYTLPQRSEHVDAGKEIADIEAQAKAQVDAQIAAQKKSQPDAVENKTTIKKEDLPQFSMQQTSAPASTALGLYPLYFMDGADIKSDFITVIGGEAPASYVVATSNLIARTAGKKPTGFSMLDGDIADVGNYDAIVVGNACNNEIIAKMFNNPSPCDNAPLPAGKGLVRLYQSANGKVLLLAAGKTDALVLSAVNAIGTDSFKTLTKSETCVDKTALVSC